MNRNIFHTHLWYGMMNKMKQVKRFLLLVVQHKLLKIASPSLSFMGHQTNLPIKDYWLIAKIGWFKYFEVKENG